MTLKRFTLVFALLALLTAGVSAHDEVNGEGIRGFRLQHEFGFPLDDDILLEATGLDADSLRAALMEGSTMADLIAANEGDVAAVIADVVAQMTDEINASAAEVVEGLGERVSEEFNAEHTFRGPWGRRWFRWPRTFGYAGVADVITEATGLDKADLRSALAEGSTFADLIEANDGDVASVAADLVATITDEVNAAAAERVASLEENITELFNSDLADRLRRGRRGRMKPRFFFGFWGMTGTPASETPAA